MRFMLILTLLAFLPFLTALAVPAAQVVRLKEYLGRAWTDELISYPLSEEISKERFFDVTDETGAHIPSQRYSGRLYLLVDLPADAEKVFTIVPGKFVEPLRHVIITARGGQYTLDSGVMAVRIPLGVKEYKPPLTASEAPGPLQGVRGPDGTWIGKSWLQAPVKVTGYETMITALGPLFAEARVTYTFEGDRKYIFTVRVIAGQPLAIIDEAMNLNPDDKYSLLTYGNDTDRSTWEWWALDDSEHLGVGATGHQHPANAVFSFYGGLQPNQCRWIAGRATQPRKGVNAAGKQSMEVEAGEAYAPLKYDQDEQFNRLTGWWLNSFSDRSYAFTMYNDANPEGPAVSLIMGRPSRNVNPNLTPTPAPWIRMVTGLNDMRILAKKSKDLQVYAPICLGSREWMLSVAPQTAFPAKGTAMPYTYQAMLKYDYFPLEKIKDWTFDWSEPNNAWPRLFCRAGDLKGMQDRAAKATGEAAKSQLIPAIYQPKGTADAMAKQALTMLKTEVDNALSGSGHGGINWFHASLHMMQAMPIFEAAMATPGIDPAARKRIKAYGAFIAQQAWDDDYWPPKETANGWGSVNMGTLAGAARVLTAAAMAGHPKDAAWLKRSRGYLDGNLGPLQFADGSNVSCPHYMGASMEPILYMALALKYGGGYDAFKDDPRLQRCGQFMIDILTPVDPRVKKCTLWPLGHTSRTETTSLPDLLALGYSGIDEPLAGALRKMSAEMGATSSGAFVATTLLSNTTSAPVDPVLGSRWYPNYGAILRDNRPAETWFAIRYSKTAFDHFQSDMGAFTLYAKGAPLMMDFGSMYSPENGQAVYHNRIAWDVKEGAQKPCPGFGKPGCYYQGLTNFAHKFEPWTAKAETFAEVMGPTDAFGEVKAFISLPAADFLCGQTDIRFLHVQPYFPETPEALAADPNQKMIVKKVAPYAWLRRVLFAKPRTDADQPYLLIRDDFTGPCLPPTASYWVMANNVTFTGNRAHATGQFGVDLDLYAIQPAQPKFSKWQWEHKNWGGEKQLCIRITQPDGKPFLVLLYPRRPAEPAPAVTSLANGNGVKIVQPGGMTDYAFLSPTPVTAAENGMSFQGTAGYIRLSGDQALVALTAPGKAMANGVTLDTPQAADLQVSANRLVLHTRGEAHILRLSGKLPAGNAAVDGKPADAAVQDGVLTVAVPAGEHEVVVGK